MVINDLFTQVLDNKDLSRAGDLFSLDDDQIVDDLSEVLQKIRKIVEEDNYIENDNDQSVVEICVTRVTTAIRETGSIERHTAALKDLLESCLEFDLEPSSKQDDPPHAKIASDVMTCLFVHYDEQLVMETTLPVVIKFLNCSNKELSRNVSSYLSLAAIDNSDLLANYNLPILHSILQGNLYLTRVLPQLYGSAQGVLEEHVDDLVKLLDQCDMAERSSLLELFAFISKTKSELLEPHVSSLCDCLSPNLLAPLTLRILVDICMKNHSVIEPHLSRIKHAAELQASCIGHVSQILGIIGATSEVKASEAVKYLLCQLASTDHSMQACVLQEIRSIALVHHFVLTEALPMLDEHSRTCSSSVRFIIQQITDDYNKYFGEREVRSVSSQTDSNVTVITILAPDFAPSTAEAKPVREPVIDVVNDSESTDRISSEGASPECKQRSVGCMSDEALLGSTDTSSPAHHTDHVHTSSTTNIKEDTSPDAVQQFCDKHLHTIKTYIDQLSTTLPLPTKCCVVNGKHKRFLRLSFHCFVQSDQCIYTNNYFALRTKLPYTWLHLMFLGIQSKSGVGLGQNNTAVKSLKACLDALRSEHSPDFITLTTSAFPTDKDKDSLLQELNGVRFFDVFEFHNTEKQWMCFVCNHPEKVTGLLQDGTPTISGQLKEKKGRWKFFKRWKTRYFTLSGSQITYNKNDTKKETLPISKIQSVKAVRKGGRDIPKAFEIFTADQTYIFKARDHQNAEQWLQCLQIAMARSQCCGERGSLG